MRYNKLTVYKRKSIKYERHGLRSLPEYQVWLQMKGRCHNKRNKRYSLYGGRGIRVCERWYNSFRAFYEDMGPRPDGGLLERKDNFKNYEPGNCVWAAYREQSRNKRNNIWLEFNGQRMILADWARFLGIEKNTLRSRIFQYGWSAEKALSTPINAPRKNSRFLTFRGETLPMCDWARRLGLDYKTLKSRLRAGWSIEKALMSQ